MDNFADMGFIGINEGVELFKKTENAVLLDVREKDEYDKGHVPGSVNLPLSRIEDISIDPSSPVFVYCLSGGRSARAAQALRDLGYENVVDMGGIMSYRGEIEKRRQIVIVGGVAGGATAAARIRRLDEHADVTVYERSGFISYANCGLPYYVGGVITDPKALTLQTPESFWKRFRINMLVNHEVTSIDPKGKTVSVKDLKTGKEFVKSYDKLILAPGARPAVPRIPGADGDKVFTLRTVEDTFRLHEFTQKSKPSSAVVIGGGFVGVEVAENLAHMGIDTTIVDMLPQLMNQLDPEIAAFVHAEARKNGVKLVLGASVSEIVNGNSVILGDGTELAADMAVLAAGVVPESALAAKAGLETGVRGSIAVNERMQTSETDIYAVGDAVQVKNFVTDEPALISLAGPANKQARIAADNICGVDSVFRGSQGSSIIKVFDLSAASTGINEKTAKRLGLDYDKIYLSPADHAGYYPGSTTMTVKVLFGKKDGLLLGAQIVGYGGVDKRIDVFAAAIRAGMKMGELCELELAYAPPYSSAKDPVNMAGFMADNILNGRLKQFFLEDEPNLPRDGSVNLLDVRTPAEYSSGHFEGFKNIPVDELRERIGELEKGKPVYVNCQSGIRSYIACRILTQNGFEAYNFSGGYRLYQTAAKDRQAAASAAPCGKE